jgi:O-antigen ligase
VATRPPALPRLATVPGATPLSVRISIAAVGASVLLASALAYEAKLGAAIMLALGVVPLAMLRLRLAICGWIVLLFFSRSSVLEAIPNRLLLLIVAAGLGLLASRRATVREALARNWVVIAWAAALVVWTLLSLGWAPAPSAAERPIKELLYAFLGFVLVLGAIVERRHARWLATAFVAGAALSVLWGAAKGGLSVSGSEVADLEGRLQAGAGDPNFLAALLVPAIMLACGLAVRRSRARRLLLGLATVIIAVGLAATQSRGGLIAAGVCAGVALIILRGRRGLILLAIGLAAGVAVIYFAGDPTAWHRITQSNHGSGRLDIWKVAWRVVHDHPFVGVGVAQFPQVSPHYVLQPGALQYVNLIVEKHIVVHNLYLGLWAETGIIGLLLFLGLAVVSLLAGWNAVRQFDAQGDEEMSGLARGGVLALIAILVTSVFLSNLAAGPYWVVLAFGPALNLIATRAARASPALDPG